MKPGNKVFILLKKRKLISLFCGLILLGVLVIKGILLHQLLNDLSLSTAKQISKSLNDTLEMNERIMSATAREIARNNGKNLELIKSIITDEGKKSKTDLLSWTVFDWNDKYGQQLVNSEAGILTKKLNVSDREYFALAKQTPWEMVVGDEVVFGRNSRNWVIPLAFGITDNYGKFIGVLVAGLDVKKIMMQLERLGLEKVDYRLIDKNNHIVLPDELINTNFEVSKFFVSQSITIGNKSGYQIIAGFTLKNFMITQTKLAAITLMFGVITILLFLLLCNVVEKLYFLIGIGLSVIAHKTTLDPLNSATSAPIKRLTEVMLTICEQQRAMDFQHVTYNTFFKECNEYALSKLTSLKENIENLESWVFDPYADKKILKHRYNLFKESCANIFDMRAEELDTNSATDILSMIEKVQVLFSQQCLRKDIIIKIHSTLEDYAHPSKGLVYLNRFSVQYLISSVVAHSMEFLPSGSSMIISISQKENFMIITIEDDGQGITEQELALITKEFRGHYLSSLGIRWLSLQNVSDCLEKVGGFLKRSVCIGGGAQFTLQIPVALPKESCNLVKLHEQTI